MSTESLSRFFSIAFCDLLDAQKKGYKPFEELFFGRSSQLNDYKSLMLPERRAYEAAFGRNILITGDAGVGKTNFLYCLLHDKDVVKSKTTHIVVDYRNCYPSNDLYSLLYKFISDMDLYFKENSVQCTTLRLNEERTAENVNENALAVRDHVDSLDHNFFTLNPLVIILDDFDYVEENLYWILNYFVYYAEHSCISIVVSARPQLQYKINFHDDRLSLGFLRNVEPIKLKPLPSNDVVFSRIAPLLKQPESLSILRRILGNTDSIVADMFRKEGHGNLSELPELDFALNAEGQYIIDHITDGNIREMFDICKVWLLYRYKNNLLDKTLTPKDTRKEFLDIFYLKHDQAYFVDNINEIKSKTGNSLYANILQAVKIERSMDESVKNRLRNNYKHKTKDIDTAISVLSDKASRYIVHRAILPKKKLELIGEADSWEITKKGSLYLKMLYWQEYVELAGQFGVEYRA